ncbi:MAG: hypothetical protein IPP30_05155 [Flavobacterium sp.]|nr:hypothetical protein [Flavobacterium sp.]
MKNSIQVFMLLLFAVAACSKKESKVEQESCSKESKGKSFKMYQMSEMSTLMEQMYVDNQRLKTRILKGDTIGKFPNHFLKIHSAVMTDPTENDLFFKEQAQRFIAAQELIYKDPKNAKQHFNDGVNSCIQCHEEKCGGPITRIKKLYIP